jgi:hypothetical protein
VFTSVSLRIPMFSFDHKRQLSQAFFLQLLRFLHTTMGSTADIHYVASPTIILLLPRAW